MQPCNLSCKVVSFFFFLMTDCSEFSQASIHRQNVEVPLKAESVVELNRILAILMNGNIWALLWPYTSESSYMFRHCPCQFYYLTGMQSLCLPKWVISLPKSMMFSENYSCHELGQQKHDPFVFNVASGRYIFCETYHKFYGKFYG